MFGGPTSWLRECVNCNDDKYAIWHAKSSLRNAVGQNNKLVALFMWLDNL